MSKTTQVRTGAFSKFPTQNGGREPIPDNAVGNNALKDLAVTNDKIADTTIEEGKLSSALQSKIVGDFVIEGFQDFVKRGILTAVDGAPAAGQFRSDIINRTNIPDITSDLMPRFGINRIHTNHIERVEDEVGPAGETVYKSTNDDNNQIRFVGGGWISTNGTSGAAAFTDVQDDYVEIVFYGTGLNLLDQVDGLARDFSVSVDGGSYTSKALTGNGVLNNRNYNMNVVRSMTSGLSYGIHTVRIKENTGTALTVFGFEIINENTDFDVPSGDTFIDRRLVQKSIASTSAFDSGFTNTYGTPGARGSHVLAYLDSAGTFKKDIRYTETAQANLGSADHSNEEVIREYSFREFGAGRSDDFSNAMGSAVDRAFTLEDGTTSLSGEDVQQFLVDGYEILFNTTTGDFFTFTWVGTGLDFRESDGASTIDTMEFFIDGSSVGTTTSGVENGNIRTVVSGLPYGTHTCKVVRNTTGVASIGIVSFITYGPKEPVLPSNSIKLADYFLMADFVANTTTEIENISTGVLRKNAVREMTYIGSSWGITSVSNASSLAGHTFNNAIGDTMAYTFYGTGFDLRQFNIAGRTSDVSVRLNGIDLTAANYGTATFTTHGCSYNSGTATLDCNSATSEGAGFITSGLPLALYTVEFENEQNLFFEVDSLDIITPVHSPKSSLRGNINNALPVGSQCIGDGRALSPLKDEGASLPNWARAVGLFSTPTTTSTSFVPVNNMHATIKTNGNPIELNTCFNIDCTGSVFWQFQVDGVLVGPEQGQGTTASSQSTSSTIVVPVAPGVHFVQLMWRVGAGTGTIDGQRRVMTVKELK